jgi:transposase InsO family protein
MKYAAIDRSKDEFPVSRLCETLGVSESGYYAWSKREPSPRTLDNSRLREKIVQIWSQVRGIYGAPRIHAELLAQGIHIGLNRVAKLMREAGIRGKSPRKRRPRTTQADPTHSLAPNVLGRQFTASRPDEVWLTDITYIETEQGYLYLAGVMDMYSRQIVGMAMADHLRTELVESALDMAITHRCPSPDLLHHSDRGSQYTSAAYRKCLSDHGMIVSMSRTGDCLDNAPMESFWATLKRECADHVFANFDQARTELFRFIMGFYNRLRRHSALGYLSPAAFEQQTLRHSHTPSN